MEKVIVRRKNPAETIDVDETETLMKNDGIILAYEDEKIIGSVVYDPFNEKFLFGMFDKTVQFSCLNEVLRNFLGITFKYMTYD